MSLMKGVNLAVNRLPVVVWRPTVQRWIELEGAVETWSVVILRWEVLICRRL